MRVANRAYGGLPGSHCSSPEVVEGDPDWPPAKTDESDGACGETARVGWEHNSRPEVRLRVSYCVGRANMLTPRERLW